MHILIALYKYFDWGGLQKDTRRLMETAVQEGHTVTVFTTAWDGSLPKGDSAQIEFTRRPVRGFTNHAKMNDFESLFAERLHRRDFDVSIAMNRIAGADFYFAADSCMKTYMKKKHSQAVLRLLPRYRAILKMEENVVGPLSQTIVLTIAQAQKKEFQEEYGIEDDRIKALPPGMNPLCVRPKDAEQRRTSTRHALHIADDELLLMLVGTNHRRKGLDRALSAMAALPDDLRPQVRFALVGADDSRAVRKLASRLGVESQFMHLGPRQDVNDLLLAADVMVHPAREEGTGTVLVEGLAAGLPVLCTAACGFSTYVQEATQTVTDEPFDQNQLNRMLSDMLRQLPALKEQTIRYAQRQDFCSRASVMLRYMKQFVDERHPLHDKDIAAMLQMHRQALADHSALKDTAKRKVSRVTLNGRAFIVKEYCHEGRLINHVKQAIQSTRLLNGLTPQPAATWSVGDSQYIIFPSCGTTNFFNEDLYGRPDVLELVRECGRLMATLHQKGLYHHDAKSANFVPNDDYPPLPVRVVLIDCDNVTPYKSLPPSRQLKNLGQFIAGTAQCPPDRWLAVIRAFLDAYGQEMKLSTDDIIALYRNVQTLEREGKVESYLRNVGKNGLPDAAAVFSDEAHPTNVV